MPSLCGLGGGDRELHGDAFGYPSLPLSISARNSLCKGENTPKYVPVALLSPVREEEQIHFSVLENGLGKWYKLGPVRSPTWPVSQDLSHPPRQTPDGKPGQQVGMLRPPVWFWHVCPRFTFPCRADAGKAGEARPDRPAQPGGFREREGQRGGSDGWRVV